MNFDPPPFTYCSSRSPTRSAGPKAVQASSVGASTLARGMKGERQRARGLRAGVEAVVHEGPEVVARHLAPGLGGEGQRLVDADTELIGRDERRDPAVSHPTGATHRGLAVAADPQRHGLLDRARQDRNAIEAP